MQQLADIREAGGAALPIVADPQQPLQPAASFNDPISEENIEEGLLRLHNGRAKGMQGLPSEFLRYARSLSRERSHPSTCWCQSSQQFSTLSSAPAL